MIYFYIKYSIWPKWIFGCPIKKLRHRKSTYRVFPSQYLGAVCYSMNTPTPKPPLGNVSIQRHNASTSPWSCNFVASALTILMSIVYRWGVVPERMYTLQDDISTSDGNSTQKMSKPVRILSGTSDRPRKFNTSKSCVSHRKWNFNLAF